MIDEFEFHERLKEVLIKGNRVSVKQAWEDDVEMFKIYVNYQKKQDAAYADELRDHLRNLINPAEFMNAEPGDPSLEIEGEIFEEEGHLYFICEGFIKEWKSYVDGIGEKQMYQDRIKSEAHSGKFKLFNL